MAYNSNLKNNEGRTNSLQISEMGDIPSGLFSPGVAFLVKNITDENITATVKLANSDKTIETVFYPGWNVEQLIEITVDTDKSLQYGF